MIHSLTRGLQQLSSAVYAFGEAGHLRAILVLVLLSLILFTPGLFWLQPMDRDEPRFAQASKQMLETGDFVRIRFQKTARNNKPAGIYWLQSAAVTAGEAAGVPDARRTIWLYRLVSLAGALAVVLLTYWTALAFAARGPAMLAAMLLAATVLLGVEARLAKTDAVLLASVVAAMGALARMYLKPSAPASWRLPLVFWTAIGAGLLLKGPITPMVCLLAGLTLLVADRAAPWFRSLRPAAGILWALLLAAPWFILIIIETKGAFLADSIGKDMLAKVGSGKESHGAPPLTYFAAFWGTAWPMAPLAALAAPYVWKNRREKPFRFLLAWLVPVWLLFELVPTKLPHYVLPTYPAIAILTILTLEKIAPFEGGRWRRWIGWLLPLVPALLLAAAIAVAVFTRTPPGWTWYVLIAAAVFLGWFAMQPHHDPARRIMVAVFSAMALYSATYTGVLVDGPGRVLAVSPKMATMAQLPLRDNCKEPAIASAGYYEPSLVFLTRTDMVMTSGAGAAQHLLGGPCRLAFVEKRQEPAFLKALADRESVRPLGRITGINLNGGKRLDIGVWFRQ